MTLTPPRESTALIESQDALFAYNNATLIRPYLLPAGTPLFRKGEERHCAYLIDKGTVHILDVEEETSKERILCVLGPGEIFGEMALIDNMPRSASAITVTECEVFVIPRAALQERVKGLDPIITLMIGLLIERYRTTRIHLPESIKQDGVGDLIQKIGRANTTAFADDEIERLRTIKLQREAALHEMKLEQELRQGIERREFVPVLQPILSLPGRKLLGFEALIRWENPQKGLVMPNDFIPVAERSGMVQHLDQMMLEWACELLPDMRKLCGDASSQLFISVNMSGINFALVDVIDMVGRTLKNSGADPSGINLEITESALIGEPIAAEATLQGLRALGVSVSLDDFGTGYSSLSYLHKFTIDNLKIDRSFVVQMHEGRKTRDIVGAIVALAQNFDLGVVAEGIETEIDVTALNIMGCDKGQGYLFSRPLSIEDAKKYVRDNLVS